MSICNNCGSSDIEVFTKDCGGYYYKDQYAFAMCRHCGKTSNTYSTRNIRAAAHGIVFDIDMARAAALRELTTPGIY